MNGWAFCTVKVLSVSTLLGVIGAHLLGCTGDIGTALKKESSVAGATNSAGDPSTMEGTPGTAGPGVTALASSTTLGDPGRITLHRLNRLEYNNTVRDLLGTSLHPADNFLADDKGHGFDNIADVLSLSPVQFNLYEQAADALVQEALGSPQASPTQSKVLLCDLSSGAQCVRNVVSTFAERAWRRPLVDQEVSDLLALVALAQPSGDDITQGVRVALKAVLLSPHFLFRVERDPDPTSPVPHPLNSYELASRLSYFLWSSLPDQTLFDAAKTGALSDPNELQNQVQRMLADPKADALVGSFTDQWLGLRDLQVIKPDPTVFPQFDETLRVAMLTETHLFFRDFLQGASDVHGLLKANFTFLNDRLATHYGLPSPGANFVRVSLPSAERGGLLTQASVLTVTSTPVRSSPTLRGQWVLGQLLCSPPPPPPPNAGKLDESKVVSSGSLRQVLEAHRAKPECASCHQQMDPLGFGLENYNGIGAWRTQDQGMPVDASGTLSDGRMFQGAAELENLLANDARLEKCIAQQLFIYALGRGTMDSDNGYLTAIVSGAAAGSNSLKDILIQIVLSAPFRTRHGEPMGQGS